MAPAAIRIRPFVVTAKREDPIMNPVVELPSLRLATSEVSAREIEEQGAKTAVDAIKYVPGAWIETRGRKVKQFVSIRGQVYPYPEYSINGMWQREFHEMPYFFSAENIQNIEIVRSSAALLTGLSGLAGVIKIQTKSYEATETSLKAEYGSFARTRLHLAHGSKRETLQYGIGLGYDRTAGPEGKHAAETFYNLYGQLEWNPAQAVSIQGHFFHLNGSQQLTFAIPPATKALQDARIIYDPLKSSIAQIKAFVHPEENLSTEFQLSYAHRDPVVNTEDPKTHAITGVSEKDYEWSLQLLQTASLIGHNVIRAGGLYNRWISPNGKRFYTGRRNDIETYSFVIVDEHQFGALGVNGGIRWAKSLYNEFGAYDIEGSGTAFAKVPPILNEWQPALVQGTFGLTFAVTSGVSLEFNAAAGEINPRVGTLDTDFQVPKDETRYKFDLGLEKRWSTQGKVALTGFAVIQKDAILYSGTTYEAEDGRILEFYENQDQNQIGVELDSRFSLFGSLYMFFNVTGIRSRVLADGKWENNKKIPDLITNGGLMFDNGRLDGSLLIKYISRYQNNRFAQGGIWHDLGDYVSLDFTAGYAVGGKGQLRLYLEVVNALDSRYTTVVGYPDFGRQVMFGSRYSIRP